MNNFKKVFSVVASVMMMASVLPTAILGVAAYDEETTGAYEFAFDNGITTKTTIEAANMWGALIRTDMAKMMVNYAKEVLGKTNTNTSEECAYTDISNETTDAKDYIVEACQMGLMGVDTNGVPNTTFNPQGTVTRAMFGTVISRTLYGTTYNGGEPYYLDHLNALQDAGIMTDLSNPERSIQRGHAMLMMQRAAALEGDTPDVCDTLENQLACSMNLSTCPAECEETNVDKAGNLSVSMESAEGMDIPHGISSLEVATYTFEADAEDIELGSVTLEQLGYSDDGTLTNVALFIDGQRVSKTVNIDADDALELDLTSVYTIKAGSSVDITVMAEVGPGVGADNVSANGDKFAIELTEANSTAEDVNYDANLTSDTFTVLSKANDSILVQSGSSLDDVVLGSTAAELFEFKLDNSNDQDATFKSITLKGYDSDYADYFENFELQVGGEAIATTDAMNGKYLTFNIEDGYAIGNDDYETFTVVADVKWWSSQTITFEIEKAMDVVVIGDKYDVAMTANIDTMKSVDISAGDVTLSKTNPGSTAIVRNRTLLALGAFTITNNAGGDINLQDFDLEFTTGSASTGIANILKNVKVRLGSPTATLKSLEALSTSDEDVRSYDINSTGDLGKAIGAKLIVYVYADIEDKDMKDAEFYMTVKNVAIEEAADEDPVSDITPSLLKFSTMKGSDSALKFTEIPLAPKSVAKDTANVEAVKFTVKTSSTEWAKITKLTFDALSTNVSVNSTIVSAATLKVGTEDPIDVTVRSGSIVVNDDITLAKNTTTTFILNIDLSSTATGSFVYNLSGAAAVEAEDTSDDKNELTISPTVGGKQISVQQAGVINFDYNTQATNNKYAKNILAGEADKIIGEYSARASYTPINVDEIEVTFNTGVKDALANLKLYLGGDLIAENPTWDATKKIATFDSDVDFDLSTTETALLVKVDSAEIVDGAGLTVPSANITSILFTASDDDNGTWGISAGQTFGIVPVTITTARNDTTDKITATADRGVNTTSTNQPAKAYLTGMSVTVGSSNGMLYSLEVLDGSTVLDSWIVNGTSHTFTWTGLQATADLTVTATTSGAIDPSYRVTLNEVEYYTTVDGIGMKLTDRGGAGKVLFNIQ